MTPLADFPVAAFARIRFVLTDMDDTLTFRGRLSSDAYAALERLQRAGIIVLPITAAPAGWCDLMVRQWPVDAVIGENGGFYFACSPNAMTIRREFWLDPAKRTRSMDRLEIAAQHILAANPGMRPASDQPFRQTTWAIEPSGDGAHRAELADKAAAAWRAAGARSTINSLWVLGWFGEFDKLAMTLRMGRELFAADLSTNRETAVYVGDSLNDEPMFRHFPYSVGVATVTNHLEQMETRPRWITKGPGGSGFVEVAAAVLAGR